MELISFLRRSTDHFRHCLRDDRGQMALLFGLALAPVAVGVGAAIDYTRMNAIKTHLQAAADAAALGATASLTQGSTVAQAEALGQQIFRANAPKNSTMSNWMDKTSYGALTIQSSFYAQTATTLVNYQGAPPTIFSGVLGTSAGSLEIKSAAQATTGSGSGAQTYAGVGTIDGDPYVTGADGVFHDMMCTAGAGAWYNVLSDAGIQVNASCDPSIAGAEWQVLSGFSVILNNHVITLTAPRPQMVNGKENYGAAWYGQITIDGVNYPAVMGSDYSHPNVTNYLGGQVQTSISDTAYAYLGDNWVTVTTPTYIIRMTFDYQTFAAGDIRITAKNAGQCGVPGGILGGLLAGSWDDNTDDYTMSEATAKSYQFYWRGCGAQSSPQTAHLIQ